ncbi:MAG: polysaccharide deacetylase family protein, partial [Bacteroidota bacterium]
MQKLYPSLVWKKNTENKELYLTFDDGPHPVITPWVLEQLDKVNAKATFFCVGENLEKYEDVAIETLRRGNLIANHTHNHLKGWKTSDEVYINNIEQCERIIQRISPQKNPLFRPPYGRIKKGQINSIKPHYDLIMWSHLSWDFDPKLAIRKSIRAMKKADSGSIIVFHDSKKSFQNLKKLL